MIPNFGGTSYVRIHSAVLHRRTIISIRKLSIIVLDCFVRAWAFCLMTICYRDLVVVVVVVVRAVLRVLPRQLGVEVVNIHRAIDVNINLVYKHSFCLF